MGENAGTYPDLPLGERFARRALPEPGKTLSQGEVRVRSGVFAHWAMPWAGIYPTVGLVRGWLVRSVHIHGIDRN